MDPSSRTARNEPQQYPQPIIGSWDEYTIHEMQPCVACVSVLILTGFPWKCENCHEPDVEKRIFQLERNAKFDSSILPLSYGQRANSDSVNILEHRLDLVTSIIRGRIRTRLRYCSHCICRAFYDHPIIMDFQTTYPRVFHHAVRSRICCNHFCAKELPSAVTIRRDITSLLVCEFTREPLTSSDFLNRGYTKSTFERTESYIFGLWVSVFNHEIDISNTTFDPFVQGTLVESQEKLKEREALLREQERIIEERERIVTEREQALQHQLQLLQGSSQRPLDTWLECISPDSRMFGLLSVARSSESGGVPLAQTDHRLTASPSRGITPARTDESMGTGSPFTRHHTLEPIDESMLS